MEGPNPVFKMCILQRRIFERLPVCTIKTELGWFIEEASLQKQHGNQATVLGPYHHRFRVHGVFNRCEFFRKQHCFKHSYPGR